MANDLISEALDKSKVLDKAIGGLGARGKEYAEYEKYESAFMNVSFRKGVSVANRTKIEIENAWLNWYEGKNGRVITMFIDQFNVLSDETNDIPAGFSVVDDDELPFG